MRDKWTPEDKQIIYDEIAKIKVEYERVKKLYDALISLMLSLR